jgi:hypothetical protein
MPPAIQWSAPPLLHGTWHDLAPDEAMPIMIRLCAESAAARRICEAHNILALRMRDLIAIRDGLLIEFLAAPHAGGEARMGAFIYRPGLFDLIDGTSAVFHQIAREGGLVLETAEQALEYARLFCAGLQGDIGSFSPVYPETDIVQASDHPDLGPALEALRREATAEPEGGNWVIDIAVAYGPLLFRSQLRAGADGTLDMLDDRHVCGLGPLRIVGWESGLRSQSEVAAEDAPSLPCTICGAGTFGERTGSEDPDDNDCPD